MRSTFEALKAGKPFPTLPTHEAYFFAKAHKLVAHNHFISYWNSGRDKQPLTDILSAYYPPLEYNHTQSQGLPGLDQYVLAATQVFKDIK